ncbi:MAG TPA: Hpt domain-containing protein, partial [Vicinamibacterales bacterium]|nr:Hpt domain-containing protein [Vicinamibacterales bacterium]
MTVSRAAVFAAKFADEARDRLKALTTALLTLEEDPADADAAGEVLRQGHNIKGSARMLGLLDISKVAHLIEELFVRTKREGSLLDAAAFDAVFAAVDVLAHRVEQLASGATETADVTAVCERLTLLAREPRDERPVAVTELEEAEDEISAPEPEAPPAQGVRQSLRVPVERLNGLTHLAAELVIQTLQTSQRQTELRRLSSM